MSEQDFGVTSLIRDLGKLVGDEDTCDVVFFVGRNEEIIQAHKLVLWARCKFFQKYQHQFWRSRSSQGQLTFKYPQYDPETFTEVIQYMYTGKVKLNESCVFSLLLLSQDIGLDSLSHQCQQYVLRSMNITNACHFLAVALDLDKERPEFEVRNQALVRACHQYVEQHAEQCVDTDGWLELPKDSIVKLVKSDRFALEEEKVWRAVLSWAKYNSDISMEKHPQRWDNQERARVKATLEGVIENVKIMLIDSKVFAEEVEPTGLVPMEISLERYRSAAVPEQSPSEHSDYIPRIFVQYFGNSNILDKDRNIFQRTLNQWYGESKQVWKLLYRASSDGYTSEDFHRCCDGKAPTYVVIQGSTGSICGGFSDVAWTSNTPPRGSFIPSRKSFLFTLVNNQGVSPSKFEVSSTKYATLHHPGFGPMFGGGADLCIASPCNQGMECYSNLPHSYQGNSASCSILMGDYNFNVMDYEVFTTAQEFTTDI